MRSVSFVLFAFAWLVACAKADTALHFVSEAGDPVGQGQTRTLSPAIGYGFEVTADDSGSQISVLISGKYPYKLFVAAPVGGTLVASDEPYTTGNGATTSFGEDSPAAPSTGQFRILEFTRDAGGQVISLAIDFAQNSGGSAATCYGTFRYQSNFPSTNPAGYAQVSPLKYTVFAKAGQMAVNLLRRDGAVGPLSVTYATSDLTAQAGRDYTAVGGVVTWADGETAAKTITIPILNAGDPTRETVTFRVDLSGPGAGVRRQAEVTVLADTSASTFFHYSSDVYDFIGEGKEKTLNLANGYTISVLNRNDPYVFNVPGAYMFSVSGADETWTLVFANAAGQPLQVGDFDPAFPLYGLDRTHPLINVQKSGGLGDIEPVGAFQILEWEVAADGTLLKAAIDFTVHSSGSIYNLRGQLRYRSTAPVTASAPLPLVTLGSGHKLFAEIHSPGYVLVERTNGLDKALTVRYKVGGSARKGTDYQTLKGSITFKPGKSYAKIRIIAINPAQTERKAVKVLLLLDEDNYTLTGATQIKVDILPPL